MPLISALSFTNRFAQLAVAAVFLLGVAYFLIPSTFTVANLTASAPSSPSRPKKIAPDLATQPRPDHPIDHLIRQADRELEGLLGKETRDVHDAARAYRERRGRQPPPAFDVWFQFAQNHSAIIVEDFFDQIYNDLNPFWGVPAKQIREQANDFLHRISVRSGNVTQRTDIPQRPWMDLWQNLTQSVAEFLPADVDLPINVMDESRMVVPWEEIDGLMAKEQESRRIVPDEELKENFESLRGLDRHPPDEFDPEFQGMGPYWPLAVVGCPPQSDARKAYIETDFSTRPPLPEDYPKGSYEGYVQNWTLAKSPCDHAHLQGLHGTFVEPISIANTRKFFPLFGGSKLPMNNEILLPAAMYWTDDPFYSGGEEHGQPWEEKKDLLIWRGAASGGRNKEDNWKRFQRHRFVSMVNATAVHLAETGEQVPMNFALPVNKSSYNLAALRPGSKIGSLGNWIKTWSQAAVVHLLCFPGTSSPLCHYTDPYFSVERVMPMKQQYAYKYLPDLDGNSFSGRYRGFLGSTSMPIKATIYQEWHDSRLVAWRHFVPMDNTFVDIYGIMEYFLGNEDAGVWGHDEMAREIALGGKAWAERVLRREDMQIYVFRLLLEYARLCDDEREILGWKEHGAG